MISYFKKLLKLTDLNDEEDKDFERNVKDYTNVILNSSKYADSNSNTDALEKLVLAMSLGDPNQEPIAGLPSTLINTHESSDNPDDEEPAKDKCEDPEEVAKRQMFAAGENKFVDNLAAHLKLLKELEEETVIPAQPVYQPNKFGKAGGRNFVLRRFGIPNIIYEAMERNDIRLLHLDKPLTIDYYVKRFQTLLWVEEAHQAIEMRRYDLKSVMIGKYERSFLLTVPGLAEGRPSLMKGDRMVLKSDKRNSHYEGFIFEVREKDIIFKMHETLHSSAMDGLRFDVSFLTSRTPFRRCHHGVIQFKESTELDMRKIVFPHPTGGRFKSPKLIIKEKEPGELRCFNKFLNQEQRKAVVNVLLGVSRPAPYIIFGPPGTGKTVTLVEAVLQAYARNKTSKILVCGNSNSCADLLAVRIKDSKVVPMDQIVRVSAFYRMEKLIPPELEDITKDMNMISSHEYSNYRIVITTCIQSGALNEFRDKFDYVFIDEAGHANEPETLISIGLMNEDASIVLAGDPHQLGPVCISKVADQHGLGSSLLERLSRLAVYQRQVINSKMVYDSRYLTKLIICYRSDPRVMVVNNQLFYHDELKFVKATPQKWLDLLKVDRPLIFHSIKGKDRREYLNPSWFNANEAIACLSYVNRLYSAGLKPHQLGIITPYRRQIDKLNLLFESCNFKRCKIATMEEFQGDEREVIIISTVRTREKNIQFDQKFKLGFLFNPKRFNVAISRAKWMVIVVADDQMLSRDDCWKKYMDVAFKIEDPSATVPESD